MWRAFFLHSCASRLRPRNARAAPAEGSMPPETSAACRGRLSIRRCRSRFSRVRRPQRWYRPPPTRFPRQIHGQRQTARRTRAYREDRERRGSSLLGRRRRRDGCDREPVQPDGRRGWRRNRRRRSRTLGDATERHAWAGAGVAWLTSACTTGASKFESAHLNAEGVAIGQITFREAGAQGRARLGPHFSAQPRKSARAIAG
jgi:hypothetical protein